MITYYANNALLMLTVHSCANGLIDISVDGLFSFGGGLRYFLFVALWY